MGRQTAIALSKDDERVFLTFLRTDADVRIMRRSAKTQEMFFIPEFPSRESGEHTFTLWNIAFPWNPEFAQYRPEVHGGQFYVNNTHGAPVIEYSREAFENPKAIGHGRVYWNTDFDIYHGPKYETAAFNRWFDKIVRWLRKNGKRVEVAKGWYQFWLPGAWELKQLHTKSDY